MSSTVLAGEVGQALEDLEALFPGQVTHEPDGVGGAYVTVSGIELGGGWTQASAALSFHIPYNYPAAAPYPYYLPGDVHPTGAWPQALQSVEWRGEPRVQVSLRHNRWDPQRDRAVGCVLQVGDWLRHQ